MVKTLSEHSVPVRGQSGVIVFDHVRFDVIVCDHVRFDVIVFDHVRLPRQQQVTTTKPGLRPRTSAPAHARIARSAAKRTIILESNVLKVLMRHILLWCRYYRHHM